MPVYQELVNFDQVFHQLKENPIIINHLSNNTEEEREAIRNLITTRCTSDLISILPSCQCGRTKGEYAVSDVCVYCKTPVISSVSEDIEPLVWFKRPEGVEKLINPIIYTMLRRRLMKSGFDVLDWLLDTNYRSEKRQPQILNTIAMSGIQRGYNNFIQNFEKYIDTLFSMQDYQLKRPRKGQPQQRDYLYELLKTNSGAILSDYLPLPNKALLILEHTNVGRYVDPLIVHAIDAIEMLVSIDKKFSDHHPRVRENRTVKAISKLADFYDSFNAKNIAPKSGIARKHIFGTRTHFSFRAVITSITKPHNYDEIEIPWGVGVTVLHEHLISKLLRNGRPLNDAIGMLRGHVQHYNEEIDSLFKEILAESRDGCLYAILQRNPSLLQGSLQRVKITRVKTDIYDTSIGMSILIVRAPNADQCLVQ